MVSLSEKIQISTRMKQSSNNIAMTEQMLTKMEDKTLLYCIWVYPTRYGGFKFHGERQKHRRKW